MALRKKAAAEVPAESTSVSPTAAVTVASPAVTGAAPHKPVYMMDFAVSMPKLDRAQKDVSAKDATLQGDAYVAAVKARYIELGGLLAQDKPAAVEED